MPSSPVTSNIGSGSRPFEQRPLGAVLRVVVDPEDRRQVRAGRAQQLEPAGHRRLAHPLVPQHDVPLVRLDLDEADEPAARPLGAVRRGVLLLEPVVGRLVVEHQHAVAPPRADLVVHVALPAGAGQDQVHHVERRARRERPRLRVADHVEGRRDRIGDRHLLLIEVQRPEGPHRCPSPWRHRRIVTPFNRSPSRLAPCRTSSPRRGSATSSAGRLVDSTFAVLRKDLRRARTGRAVSVARARRPHRPRPCGLLRRRAAARRPVRPGRHGARARRGGGVPRPRPDRRPVRRAGRGRRPARLRARRPSRHRGSRGLPRVPDRRDPRQHVALAGRGASTPTPASDRSSARRR